jgi:hypothetical protein
MGRVRPRGVEGKRVKESGENNDKPATPQPEERPKVPEPPARQSDARQHSEERGQKPENPAKGQEQANAANKNEGRPGTVPEPPAREAPEATEKRQNLEDFGPRREPGEHVPDNYTVVKGGEAPPKMGETFSVSAAENGAEAGRGVPHGQVHETTAGQIRAAGGDVTFQPEPNRSGTHMNHFHADAHLPEGAPSPFEGPKPNPAEKNDRIPNRPQRGS